LTTANLKLHTGLILLRNPLLNNADNLVGVSVLVVVPDVDDASVASALSGKGINLTSMGGSDEVKRDSLAGVRVSKVVVEVTSSLSLKGGVDLLGGSGLLEVEDHDGDGNIRGGNTDGRSGKLASKLGKRNGDGLTGTSLGDNHVERSSTSTAVSVVVVVDEVLVVGERVDGLDVAGHDAELLVEDSKRGYDGVGGAGSSREDLVRALDDTRVDTGDDVLDSLTRSGEDGLGGTLGGKVLGEAGLVTPDTGVIDNNSVLDTVFGVVNILGLLGVDQANLLAVDDQGVVGLIHRDGSLERAVDRVALDELKALLKIRLLGLADDNALKLEVGGDGGKDAGQKTSDAAESVKDNITLRSLV